MNRSIAIVSGKGGSGKTMVSASIAQIFSSTLGRKVTLVDADLGTAGLSYYLGLKLVRSIRPGLADLLGSSTSTTDESIPTFRPPLQVVETASAGFEGTRITFLPIGDQRRLLDSHPQDTLLLELRKVISLVAHRVDASYTVVDCRGGVDDETLSVCRAVDDIILVTEADTTSFQASRHLVETLADKGLASKLRGFIVNKVFEDPTVFGRTGSSTFGTRYLGSIPFDVRATRSFLVGDLPHKSTSFTNQLTWCLLRDFPELPTPSSHEWTPRQFAEVALRDPDADRGGRLLLILTMLLLVAFLIRDFTVYRSDLRLQSALQLSSIGMLFLISGIEPVKRKIWRVLQVCMRLGRRSAGDRDRPAPELNYS